MVVPHNKLRVHKDVPAEYQRGRTTIDQLDRAVGREKGSHEAEEDQEPERAE